MSIKPHWRLGLITPDAAAECWEGVPDWLYRELWGTVRYLGPPAPEPDVNSVHEVWKHLSTLAKLKLNELAGEQ